MSHGRKKPRVPRPIVADPMRLAMLQASKLPAGELAAVLQPVKDAFKALREGVATSHQWDVLASAFNVAKGVERKGVVRGLQPHLVAAELALHAIWLRGTERGVWKPTPLYWQEIEHLSTALELHEYQLKQLGRGEALQALRYAEAEVASSGGRVVHVDMRRAA